MGKKLTNEEFLDRAHNVHKDHYEYLEPYVDAKTPIKIFCTIHKSIFSQTPNKHLGGHGCYICGRQKIGDSLRSSTEIFINKAQIIHPNNDFDYSKVLYIRAMDKVEIIHIGCGKSFWQPPNAHLAGHGCTYCNTKYPLGLDKFLDRAHKIHGDKFDYSLITDYTDNKMIVPIKCNLCKIIFNQEISNHLCGQGCPECAGHYTMGTQSFIIRAKKIHDNKYDYTSSEYISCLTPITIKCLLCDKYFDQIPFVHLSGCGCPTCPCRKSKAENDWLDSLSIPIEYRNILIKIDNKTLKADAFDHNTNTIYEFYGDYWHGNPAVYESHKLHNHNRKTFGTLHQATLDREQLIKQAGYNLISMWETDWNNTKQVSSRDQSSIYK